MRLPLGREIKEYESICRRIYWRSACRFLSDVNGLAARLTHDVVARLISGAFGNGLGECELVLAGDLAHIGIVMPKVMHINEWNSLFLIY
jgi:hypothetical protein